MSDAAAVLDALRPFSLQVADLDLTDPDGAAAALERRFPIATLGPVHALLAAARDAGWLLPRTAGEVRFGRVAKPSDDLGGNSIDAVEMVGPGAPHTHPNGEVSLCFAEDGDPRFCGHVAGWVVVPPGSRHVPEVTGGRMLIVYFLPGGAMIWG